MIASYSILQNKFKHRPSNSPNILNYTPEMIRQMLFNISTRVHLPIAHTTKPNRHQYSLFIWTSTKGLCKVKKIPKIQKIIWKWVGGSRSHLDKNKNLENLPKIKFCVCTFRPCLAVHVAPRDVHACSILSRIL